MTQRTLITSPETDAVIEQLKGMFKVTEVAEVIARCLALANVASGLLTYTPDGQPFLNVHKPNGIPVQIFMQGIVT
jgi:hypothetical protein